MWKKNYLESQHKFILKKFIKINQDKIKAFLRGNLIDYSKKDFNFYEFNENFYVVIKKSTIKGVSLVSFYLGFPFAICSLQKRVITKHAREFTFYFRGEPLRVEQRAILKQIIKDNFKKSSWQEFNSHNLFRKKFDVKMKHFSSEGLLYIDPYSFIGDSFIGMHFYDSLFNKYSFNYRLLFSKNYNHLAILGEAHSIDYTIIKKYFSTYKCLLAPDLLDVNFKNTVELLFQLSGEEGIVIFPGKSLYVVIDKHGFNFFHLNQPDTTLRDQNIEEYMNECMAPFIDNNYAYQEEKFKGNEKVIYINPFGSLENKTINLDFIISLCKELNKNKSLSINLIAGLREREFHSNWIEQFIKLKNIHKIKCRLSYCSSLNQLTLDIYKFRPGAILTTDTSISHLTHRLNLPTIIFYHASRFDNSSIQSMISESPLGFGRYYKNSYPLLIREYKKTYPIIIANLIGYLASDKNNKKNLPYLKKELNELFPEEYFYTFISKKYRNNIKRILKNISPLNKL